MSLTLNHLEGLCHFLGAHLAIFLSDAWRRSDRFAPKLIILLGYATPDPALAKKMAGTKPGHQPNLDRLVFC
jgi:hypothetical protein